MLRQDGLKRLLAAASAATALTLGAGAAQAVTVDQGNPCTPKDPFTNGTGDSCVLVADVDGDGDVESTPLIAKFEFSFGDEGDEDGDGDFAPTVNFTGESGYATIDGSEFDFDFTTAGSGSFTYTPDADDPFMTSFIAKGGPGYELFFTGGPGEGTFDWFTPLNPGGNRPALSNFTVFNYSQDTGGGPPEIPLPAAGWLLLSGVGGLAAAGWRKRKAA